ncbi:MAG: nuclear transport factor 2 family protein [Bacteroidetes bacterium]|nr:nuclear transport factor 2 family protein [Bacteroidota bacterium]
MKQLFTFLLLACFASYAFGQNRDEEELKQLNHDWISAYVTRDTAVMGHIFAEDLALVSPNGATFHKKDILKTLMSPNQEFLSTKVDTVSVKVIGRIGLVSAKATSVVKANGKTNTFQTSYLDVYQKRNGHWVAIASQVALLSVK